MGVNLSKRFLVGLRLDGAIFIGANFDKSTIKECSVIDTNLTSASFYKTHLENMDMTSGTEFRQGTFNDATLINVTLR